MLKRFDLMFPEDFKYGAENGVAWAAEIDLAVERGIRHFDPITKFELKTVPEIMECINKCATIVYWAPNFGHVQLGMTMFNTGVPVSCPLYGMHPDIEKILFPKGDDIDANTGSSTSR